MLAAIIAAAVRCNNVTARDFEVALENRASHWDPLVDLCGRKPERFADWRAACRIIRLRESKFARAKFDPQNARDR